jgi:2-polyprenyl-6-methoxyphenol hydroxylase-like FAD-dependent oxidoreductase
MHSSVDALVIGAGPAGAATAIWLANAGWEVVLVEQHRYPRRKVCGECIAAGSLGLLDELGIGPVFRGMAGPELQQVGWMSAGDTVVADFPACASGPYRFGRALARDQFDHLLLLRAAALGVTVLQPAKARTIGGAPGYFECEIESQGGDANRGGAGSRMIRTLNARVVVDAHGSWEPGPRLAHAGELPEAESARRNSDLFAFKACFLNGKLASGLLPVLAIRGGYGGIVLSDHGRTTVACCLRRDALRACRASRPGAAAGDTIEGYLRRSCRGIRAALDGARRDGSWLSVGPLRPGIRVDAAPGIFRVGNAAGEAHPLIGEGISMALQSAALLTRILARQSPAAIDGSLASDLQHCYAAAWRTEFTARLRVAAAYAHVAMRPALALPARALLQRWPVQLTRTARLAGKARYSILQPNCSEVIV